MGQPAARLTDMHVCPMQTPGVPPIPHVGGPITGPGCPTVLIGGMPAAVMGDLCVCVGPPDTIALGSTGVFFGGKPAARMGDSCAHGGTIMGGCPTVLIGEVGSALALLPLALLSPAIAAAMGVAALAQGIVNAAVTGAPFVGMPVASKAPPTPIAQSTLQCTLQDEDGNPVENINYEITLSDGSVRKGTTDKQGNISLTGIPVGTCKVCFPDLHGDEWE
jgi:uncharacterized Zn-binding protein involved in type VI secretion